ncbi:hypothetical protein [Aquiflexum lacus]|uniref:hypothetical protein n=1 Tax=Aquiflexum lacus TaxID=2483805 RepID=UPI001894D9C7|nr:hypothetical protein [Aquiflexum lacus]
MSIEKVDGLQLTISYFSPERAGYQSVGYSPTFNESSTGRLPGLKGWDNDLPDSVQF